MFMLSINTTLNMLKYVNLAVVFLPDLTVIISQNYRLCLIRLGLVRNLILLSN